MRCVTGLEKTELGSNRCTCPGSDSWLSKFEHHPRLRIGLTLIGRKHPRRGVRMARDREASSPRGCVKIMSLKTSVMASIWNPMLQIGAMSNH